MFHTYILYNSTVDKYYIGSTSNLKNRLIEHNRIVDSRKYTQRQSGIWELVYSEEYESHSESVLREKQIKKWKSKKMIKKLVEQSRC